MSNLVKEAAPERRGFADNLAEAVLQGLIRTGAVVLASVPVRQLSKSRR